MTAIDIILPLYRPTGEWEEHIIECIRALREYFSGKPVELMFHIMNDGGALTYYPQEKLDAIKEAANGQFDFLSYDRNHGKGYAIRYAVSHVQGDLQVYTDGDFPFGWESVAHAIEALLAGSDVAMGVRGAEYAQAVGGFRKFVSHAVLGLNRFMLGLPKQYSDTQAGMKGFNAKGREKFLQTTTDSFVFDMEFILLSYRAKLAIATVPMKLREGLSFSRMGFKTMFREFCRFMGILWNVRVRGKDLKK